MIHRSRSGMLLIELLAMLILMAVLAIVLTDLTALAWTTYRDSQKQGILIHRIDAAVDALRRDAWSASSIALDNPQQITLTFPSRSSVVWRYAPDGTLHRAVKEAPPPMEADARPYVWPDVPPVAFAVSGPVVTLTFHTAPGRDESVALINQQSLAGGSQ